VAVHEDLEHRKRVSDSQSPRRGPARAGSANPQARRLTVAVTHNIVRPLWTLCGTLPPCVGWPAHNTPDRA
jgi:hypothetical protein